MEKIRITCLMLLIALASNGQSAKQVLDKTAGIISNKSGVTASFNISSQQYGKTSGTISIKGRKFHADTKEAKVWFDGKTQWTYVKQNDEVNVNTPTAADLQAINPYNFIYMYKQGYTATMTKNGQNFVVTLKAKGKSIQEMVITISQKSYVPSQIRMLQNKQWTTIHVNGFKQTNLAESTFRFNPKQYPNAEIIDLR
ncbi:MAG: outer-membrane lipoprotein carrier protein LolA [Prevotella sp.]|nr:outer-membrane lipoprotein carrier protein LolA [Prevotella sp.]